MIQFTITSVKSILNGNRAYWTWVTALFILALLGLNAHAKQIALGLFTTGMGDEVSWGLYIANFAFLVGMAAAAIMMVIPAYIFKDKEMHQVVIYSELFAVAAMIMCMLFITVDVGRPDRLWHMVPDIGFFNWPGSLLTWDVIVLNVYLILNIYVCFYLLCATYYDKKPISWLYLPVIFLAIAWAPSIHTVTAFLFQGLGGRSFWNTGLIAPRFLASAFAAGPAFMIIVISLLKKMKKISFETVVIDRIRVIVTISLLINIFFAGSELFAEFYSDSAHTVHISHLFGLHGKSVLAPWIWTAMLLNIIAVIILLSPRRRDPVLLTVSCIMIVIGIWIEKGIGFVIPGFIPSTLGDFVQYVPSMNEIIICIGIWSLGLLIYTLLLKVAIPIINKESNVNKT